MSIITGRLNLAGLVHRIETSKKSKDEKNIIIPIHANDLYLSEKGNVYLNIIAFDHEGEKQTHIVSQSISKEKNDVLKAEGKFAPTLGNLNANGIPEKSSKQGKKEDTDDLSF